MKPSERRRLFIAAVRAQIRRRHEQADEGVLAVLGTLVELQTEIRDTLDRDASAFDAYRLPELLGEIERRIERWRARAVGAVERSIESAWELGPEMVNGPFAAAEIHLGRAILPETLLEELKDYAASKIKDIGPVARKRIEEHIRRGVLGGQTPHQVMRGVQKSLKEPGPFRFVSFRAETITRTEMGRVHSLAADRRLQTAAKQVPGLKKQWIWSGKSRVMHAQISGQIREHDDRYRMPDGVRMRFPRDPEAPVEHVANCGCESVPYLDAWK